jgi:hypothetical protein
VHVLGSVSSTRGGAVGGVAGVRVGVGVGVGAGAGGAVGLLNAGGARGVGRARRETAAKRAAVMYKQRPREREFPGKPGPPIPPLDTAQ